MNLIFSADRSWGIGRDNRLLFRAKGDMAFFRETTTGKVVVMGRKTLESLPGSKPLPNRENIVLTRNSGFASEGVAVCTSLPALFARLSGYKDEDVFIIGGQEVYHQLMPYCKRALVTKFDAMAEADSFVPDFDQAPGWQLTEQSPVQTQDALSYTFCTYTQDHPKAWRLETEV